MKGLIFMPKKKTNKMPAILFYTGDWLKDPAVRCCTLEARGLWIEILCLMYESPKRGYLSLANGDSVSNVQLARMVGASEDDIKRLTDELLACGVYSETSEGIKYSRRMVSDEIVRQDKSRAGKLGMESRYNKNDNKDVTPVEDEDEDVSVIETLVNTNIVLRDTSGKNSSKDFVDARKARRLGDNPVVIVTDAIPKNRMNNPEQTRLQIQRILNVIEEAGLNVKDAAEQLAIRFKLYYASEEGQGNRFKYPHTWLQDNCHLVDPSVWNARKNKKDSAWDSIVTKG